MQILYEDNAIIVVHKPGGIPVQTSRLGQKDIVSMLKNYRAGKNEPPYIGVIHRLDQPVEGIVLFAKTKEASAKLSRQFQERSMDKYYRAVVYGRETELQAGQEGTLTDFLLKDGKTNTSWVVRENTQGAKKAVLHYRVLRTKDAFAELQIKLETGRHHQIRVQLSNANMPIIGDKKYGSLPLTLPEGADKNTALCSVNIGFIHPVTNEKMEFAIEPDNTAFSLVKAKE